jgi:hypothetical protein
MQNIAPEDKEGCNALALFFPLGVYVLYNLNLRSPSYACLYSSPA